MASLGLWANRGALFLKSASPPLVLYTLTLAKLGFLELCKQKHDYSSQISGQGAGQWKRRADHMFVAAGSEKRVAEVPRETWRHAFYDVAYGLIPGFSDQGTALKTRKAQNVHGLDLTRTPKAKISEQTRLFRSSLLTK